MAEDLFVGVDIGGTKIAAGFVDTNGDIRSQLRVPMVSSSSAEAGLNSVLSMIAQILAKASGPIKGIGICAPGPLNPVTGVILNPPNVPCWRNFPLAESVRKAHSVPVKVDNDANAAALAETRWGSARGYKHVFYATIGTGIGTGIVFDGKVYHGRTGSAGEGGHVSIDHHGPVCRCGKPGCIEILASGTALTERARKQIAAGTNSAILQIAGGKLDAINGHDIAKAYAAGDPLAIQILTEAVDMLALWLSNIVDLLDPDVIVIGGGAAALYNPFFDRLQSAIPKLAVNPQAHEVPILPARYGEDAGIAGGAALCS